jgi:predicted amino acid dehydrogenase
MAWRMSDSRQPESSLVSTGERHFCFVVHALSRIHRGVMGVPSFRPGLVGQWRDGTAPEDVLRVCTLRLEGVAVGQVVGVPMIPEHLLGDQQRAVDRMEAAVVLAGSRAPVDAVGLGSLCAVVGGRGEALASRLDVPVTNGGAATAWAVLENVRTVLAQTGSRRVAVVGATSPVGRAVVRCLVSDGVHVRVDHPRGARGVDVEVCTSAAAAVERCPVVVGAGPTGATAPASVLAPGTVVVDVAIPGTFYGPSDPTVCVLAGEAVTPPLGWRRGMWGWLYHVLSGYGPSQVFACLIEPLVLATSGRVRPFSIGRTLEPEDVEAFGVAARALGFSPRLAQGWFEVPPSRLSISG